jgi:hypothetical protein
VVKTRFCTFLIAIHATTSYIIYIVNQKCIYSRHFNTLLIMPKDDGAIKLRYSIETVKRQYYSV